MSAPKSILSLTPPALANLLAGAGSRKATESAVQEMLKEGAPCNPDGTIDILKFCAWMEGRNNGRL